MGELMFHHDWRDPTLLREYPSSIIEAGVAFARCCYAHGGAMEPQTLVGKKKIE